MFFLFSILCVSKYSYACLVDAGSDCTLYVYRLNDDQLQDLPQLVGTSSADFRLSEAYYNGEIVSSAFTQLVPQAYQLINDDASKLETPQTIDDETIANTSFYVCGTSAMRQVDLTDQETIRDQIIQFFETQRESYTQTPNIYNFNISASTIITLSSTDEAAYTFIAVNSALRKTSDYSPVASLSGGNSFIASAESSSLETQNHEIYLSEAGELTIGIGDFPKFSKNSLRGNLTKQLARYSGQAAVSTSCFANGYDTGADAIIQVTGIEGGLEECNNSLVKYSLAKDKYQYNLFFDSLEQPPLGNYDYVYLTGDYFTSWNVLFTLLAGEDGFPATINVETISISDFESIGNAFCNLDRATIEELIDRKCTTPDCDPEAYKNYAMTDCFEFAIQTRILREGYLIDNAKTRRVSQIEDPQNPGTFVSVGWQMGLILTKNIENQMAEEPFLSTTATIIIGVVVFAIVLVVIIIIIVKCVKKKKEEDEEKQKERLITTDYENEVIEY